MAAPRSPPPSAEDVARHAEAIRRLARSLVHDDAAADDLAQETLRIGLELPPRTGFSPLAWLVGIARNLARSSRRATRRRVAREAAAARRDVVPATADVVARLAERRRVLDAVLALPEPYRTTVELRWFEGLAPRVIARRLDLPVETVRTRCKRALHLLRTELDRRHGGDRRAWAVALVPLTVGRDAVPELPTLLGALMTTSSKVWAGAVAGLLLLLVGVMFVVPAAPGPDSKRGDVAPAEGRSSLAAEETSAMAEAPALSVAPATWARGSIPASRADRMLALRILDDATNEPVAGAQVTSFQAVDGVERIDVALSDAEGLVTVRDPATGLHSPFAPPRLSVVARGYETFFTSERGPDLPTHRGGQPARIDLRLLPGTPVEVRVLGPDDRTPVAGAEVAAYAGRGSGVSVGAAWRVMDASHVSLGAATTDADGRARMPVAAPSSSAVWFFARAGNQIAARWIEAPLPPEPVELRLRTAFTVEGRVVNAEGEPIAVAVTQAKTADALLSAYGTLDPRRDPYPPHVWGSRWTAFTGADGRFEIEMVAAPDAAIPSELLASAAGYGHTRVKVVRDDSGRTEPVTLVLPDVPNYVVVRVRDAAGRAVSGAIVGRPYVLPMATTDAAGLARSYPLRWPPYESPVVQVKAQGFAHAWVSLADARPREGAAPQLDVVLEPIRSVTVRVLDAGGQPVDALVGAIRVDDSPDPDYVDVTQELQPWVDRVRTDAAGWATLSGVPPGALWLFAREERVRGNWGRAEVASDDQEVTVRLVRQREDPASLGSIEGEVYTSSGRPPESWQLHLNKPNNYYGTSGVGRRFSFADVAPGTYILTGNVAGDLHEVRETVTIEPGGHLHGLRIAPPVGATLRGRLVGWPTGVRGSVIAGLLPHSGSDRTEIQSDGTLQFKSLRPGTYRLRLETRPPAPALRVVSELISIQDGVVLDRELEIVSAARLWLRCDDERFATMADAVRHVFGRLPDDVAASRATGVRILDTGDHEVSWSWLVRGRHAVTVGLAPGLHRVMVISPTHGSFEGTVVIPATGEVEVQIRLVPPKDEVSAK